MDNYISEVFGNDRRRELRRKVRLTASVSLSVTGSHGEGGADGPLSVLAHTRDISATGLALIVPVVPVDDAGLVGAGEQALRIILALPAGDVEMRVLAVRHERLGESGSDVGYLIGVRITEMSEDDRDLYVEYLRGLGA